MTHLAVKLETSSTSFRVCCSGTGHRSAGGAALCAGKNFDDPYSALILPTATIVNEIEKNSSAHRSAIWSFIRTSEKKALGVTPEEASAIASALTRAATSGSNGYALLIGATCPSCGKHALTTSSTGKRLVCSTNTADANPRCYFGVTSASLADLKDKTKTAATTKKATTSSAPKAKPEDAKHDAKKSDFNLTNLGQLGDALLTAINSSTESKLEASEAKMGERMAAVAKQVAEALKPKADHFTVKLGDAPIVKIEGAAHPMLKKVLARFATQKALGGKRLKPVLLVGPAGCGKSYLGEQVAEAMALDFYQQGLSGGVTESALFGKLVPQGEHGSFGFLTTAFLTAYENGGVFLLDEMDAGDENVLLAMNNAIANGHAPVPNRHDNPVAKRHPDFYLIASANTFGKGADRVYVGRNPLDGSTLDRFQMGTYDMDYDRDLEATLVPDKELRDAWNRVRTAAATARLRRIVSTRTLVDAYDMKTAGGMSTKACLDQLVTGWTTDERKKVGV